MTKYLNFMRRIAPVINLLIIGGTAFFAAARPDEILSAFNLDDRFLLPLLIGAVAVGGLAFLWMSVLGWKWAFRRVRALWRLPVDLRATATVEFMLVIPIAACMFLTVFAIAEIAHAQLVFRYAAFSAARAGSVSASMLDGWSSFNFLSDNYKLKDADATRMRRAAIYALGGVDNGYIDMTTADARGVADALAPILPELSVKIDDTNALLPWKGETENSNFLQKRIANSDRRLNANSEAFTVGPGSSPGDITSTLRDKARQFIKQLTGWFEEMIAKISNLNLKSSDTSGSGSVLTTILKSLITPLLESILNKIVKPLIRDIIRPILNALRIISEDMDKVINRISIPPAINVNMKYDLRLRTGSLFWLITKTTNGERYLQLQRNDYREHDKDQDNNIIIKTNAKPVPMQMQSSGMQSDMPLIFPLIYATSYMVGDCTFPNKKEKK